MILGVISEAMQTQCRKCNDKQKDLLDRMADWYTKNRPDEWEAFVRKTLEDFQKRT